MTICVGKSCLFGLLSVSFVKLYQFKVGASFSFGIKGTMWDLVIWVPDHCLSFTSLLGLVTEYRI